MEIEDLIAALRARDRQKALDALDDVGEAAIDPLINLLHQSEDADLRRALVYFLDEIDDMRIVPALVDALEHDPNADVRIGAATVLSHRPDARSIEPLIAAIHDTDLAVREEVVRALGLIGAELDSPRIIDALAQALHDSDWGTRQSAAEMMIRLEAPQQEQAEQLLLADLQNQGAEIRLGAAWSLVELGDQRAGDVLAGLLDDENKLISLNAAYGLAKLGDRRAVKTLTAALSDPDEWVRTTANIALRDLEGEP